MIKKKIVVTGAGGFVGKNLLVRLQEQQNFEALPITRDSSPEQLADAVAQADAVVHLAGVNRPQDPADFFRGNLHSTRYLVDAILRSGRQIPVIFITGRRDEAVVAKALKQGAVGFLFKPFSDKALLDALNVAFQAE